MKKHLQFYLILIGLLFSFSNSSNATHLMGGSLNYEYLGLNAGSGLYEYRVTITIYRYCESGSSTLPTSLDLGVYKDNPAAPTGDKLLVDASTIPLITITPITPPNGNDTCTFAPNVCVEEGVYQAVVSLPSNTTGYYFISDRCCRNNNIVNLDNPQDAGQTYYAFAPPPNIVNSSPTFAIAPVPFICASDTASILNQANDPDGDLLVYNFVTPYNGLSNGVNPNPNPPNIYDWPIALVGYAATYSQANPFGPGGSATIDNATGLASYFAPNQGFYVLAVEIEEFRNGVLVGVTRRDLQIIVIPCPINPAPVLGGSNQTNYIINEGQTLCFSSTFNDPNNDSLFITHTGDIFNPLITNPAATFVDNSGIGTASGNFCWTTSCDQGRPTPYQFSVIATDNGCPAKITNLVYSITVINTAAPVSMSGPDTLCANAAIGISYSVSNVIGSTFNWTINNGNISGAQHGPNILVNFLSPGPASISVVTVNPNGCVSDTLTKNVFILPQPAAVAGPNIQFCSGGSAVLGGASTSGYTYSWSPTTGLSNPSVSNPTVTILNTSGTPISTTYILTTNLGGCTNTDTVVVTSNPIPVATAGPDVAVCSGNTVTIGSATVPGQTYSWSPSTGLSNTGISNPIVTLTNSTSVADTFQYIVNVQNALGCSLNDTVLVFVNPAPVANAGSNITFCGGSSGVLGSGTVGGYTYSWSPNTGLSSSTSSNPTVTLNNSSGVNDTLFYTLTTTLGPCTDTDIVQVIVQPSPVSNAGPDQLLCAGTTLQLGTTTTSGYTYSWSPSTSLSDSTISDPTLTLNNTGTTPDTLIYIVTTTLNNCVTTDTVQIISGPAPVANAGLNKNVCSGTPMNIGAGTVAGYAYSWSPTTGLTNSTISNPVLTLTNVSGVNDTLFYVVTTSLFGCIDQDTVRIIIRPNPVSNAGANQLLCAGNTIQLGTISTPGYVYLWNPSTSLNDSTISNPTLTLNNTGTTPDTLIYIVITTLNGCVTTDTVQIVSGPAPVANAGPDVIFCSGQSAPIGSVGTPGYTYTWVPALGLSSSTDPTPTVTLTNSTNVIDTVIYIVTANAFGCTDSDTITILVKPLPLSEAGANTTLCGGDTLVLGTAATTGYSYTWSPTSGLSSSTISNPILVVNNTGTTATTLTYAVLTTWNGCISSDSITITVNPQPIVSAAANPTVICVGATAVLNGSGATNYNWALLTAPLISIGTGNSLNVTPVVTTSYILTGTNGFACSGGDTITVIVNPLPPVLITAVSDTICDGDTITLAATGATSYSWSTAGGGPIGTGPSIQVSPATNTTYIVTGSDANLCSNSDSINITVNPAPTANGIIGTLSVCPSVTGVQYWISNPNPNSTYTWTVTNGTITSGQGNDTITVDWSSVSGAALVSVVEITDLGCVSANPVTLPISINVILTPVAPTGPTVFCANEAQGIVYTTLGTPGSTYNWVAQGGIVVGGNGTNTVTIDWTAPGPQTVLLWYEETSTTTTNVCFGTSDTLSILINPAPSTSAIAGPVNVCVNDSGSFSVTNTFGSTYAWTVTGATLTNGNGSNTINVNWPSTGTITISIVETNSYGCIGDTVTLPVVVNGLPAANAGPDTGVCIGQAIQLNASGGVNYIWTPATGLNNTTIADPLASPTTSTVYTVLVTDANGCRNDDSVLVTVNALPVITITPNSGVCIGSNIQLTAGGGNTYQWSPASTLDNPNSATPFANPTVNTTYTVIVTDGNGCVDSATVDITVNPLPIAVASADTLICAGTTASLFASGGVSFSWTPTQGLNNGTISNPTATPSSNTTYTVTVTDINGCQDDEQVVIDLNDQPISSFSVDGDALSANCDGIQATLINTSQDALNYTWIFPDGTTSTEVNPLYSFGFYNTNVTLIAYNNICSDTTQLNYSGALLDDVFKDISNVFTPNGDGLNDCFDLGTKYNFSDCSSMKVFNRWGEEVFTLKPGATCWNGKKNGNGEDLPSGSYFLSVHIAGKKYSGTITLIR